MKKISSKIKKGKLIVIDGSDSSGKATQTARLVAQLKKEGYKVATIDFPRYYDSFYGKMIARYLRGEFGPVDKVNPYFASLLYAGDRFLFRDKIKNWLNAGRIVIVDRYVSANMIHQTAKLKKEKEKNEFLKWLETLEFEINKIPRPDLVIYLYVPVKILLELKKRRKGKKYLKKAKDIHETNVWYLKKVEEQALALARRFRDWKMINCVKAGQLLEIETIHREIFELVKNVLSS